MAVVAVKESAELRRIRDIPRREPVLDSRIVNDVTEALRQVGGSWALRVRQALALLELLEHGGAFCPLDVGGGKTIVSLLAAFVLDAKRPLLLLPANLIKKTERDREALERHFLVPRHVRLMSYEILGRVQAASELDSYAPDLIVADECHKLKNRKAAVTRRVSRYMQGHPETRFVALSGTVMTKSLLEFAHILRWCLKGNAPVPRTYEELEAWAMALDEDVSGRAGPDGSFGELGRVEPGALLSLCTPADLEAAHGDTRTAARLGFRRRLIETPGVIASMPEDADRPEERIGASLHIRALPYATDPGDPDARVVDQAFYKLRSLWRSPVDDWPLTSGGEVWADAKELALGLTYTWDPRPPKEWLEPRRDWGAFVREILSHSRTLDSEKAVADAIDSGRLDDEGRLKRWRAVRDTFTPNTVPVWFDDGVLRMCAAWGATEPGIVWTSHRFFAEKLAELTGWRYFGRDGLAADGTFIDDAPGDVSIIASSDSNREGRNLQHTWSRNLITCPDEGCGWWQQLIGRTHRPGQQTDEVTVDVLLGCLEHAKAWDKANARARAVHDTTGANQKLLFADVEWPSELEIGRYRGARWVVPKRPDAP